MAYFTGNLLNAEGLFRPAGSINLSQPPHQNPPANAVARAAIQQAPKQPADLANRVQPPHSPATASAPPLRLSTNTELYFVGNIYTAIEALNRFRDDLSRCDNNQQAWKIYNNLPSSLPILSRMINSWLCSSIQFNPPESSFDSTTLNFLRSPNGLAILGIFREELHEAASSIDRLQHLKRAYDAASKFPSKSQDFENFWNSLPGDVKLLLGEEVWNVWRITERGEAGLGFGDRTILSNPSTLYSYKDHNILQEQISKLENQIARTRANCIERIQSKTLDELLQVSPSAFTNEIAFAQGEIEQLKKFRDRLNAMPKSATTDEINHAKYGVMGEFHRLHYNTFTALKRLVYVSDGNPQNSYIDHGLKRINDTPLILLDIHEDSTGDHLVNWAIKYYENKLEDIRHLSLLKGLGNMFKGRHPTPMLLRTFNYCHEAKIKKPLLQKMEARGYTPENLRDNPFLLTLETHYFPLPALSEFIAEQTIKCEESILDHVEHRAAKTESGREDDPRVIPEIGSERFLSNPQISAKAKGSQNIALFSVEYPKFSESGGLAPAIHGLAQSLAKTDNRVRIILPYYGKHFSEEIKRVQREKPKYCISDGTRDHQPCKVYKMKMTDLSKVFGLKDEDHNWAKRICFYTIAPDSDHHRAIFDRQYGGDERGRFAYFQSASIELLNKMNIPNKHNGKKIDVVHTNEWSTSLIIHGMRVRYPENVPSSVFAIHNGEYHYVTDGNTLTWANLRTGDNDPRDGVIEGIHNANQIVTVSRNYAKELQTSQLGFGIDPYFRHIAKEGRLTGIVNGNDTSMHNPSTDSILRNWTDPVTGKNIDLTYSANDHDILQKKGRIKEQLQKWFDLYYPEATMDFSKTLTLSLGRLVEQKGLDMVKPVVDKILAKGAQLVVIGMGDEMDGKTKGYLLEAKKHIADKWKGAGAAIIFDESTKHATTKNRVRKYQQGDGITPGIGPLLRAAADIFLMPSKFEPCGLTQNEAKSYGTPLVVATKTGGLCDTEETFESTSDPLHVTAFLCPRIGYYHDWHTPRQMQAFVNTMGEALDFYHGLTDAQRAEKMRYVMRKAARMSWEDTPDAAATSPVNQYRTVYAAAQFIPPQRFRPGPTVRVGL